MRTPSQSSSIANDASDAVPTPASTIIGTLAFSRMLPMVYEFLIQSPEPIVAPKGITATHPISSGDLATKGSSDV